MKFPYKKLPRYSDTSAPQIAMPLLPVVLRRDSQVTLPIYALLDSGADTTLMPSDIATAIGITDYRSGTAQPTVGVGQQKVDVFYHQGITLELVGDGRQLPVEIGFIETTDDRRILPLLGRTFFKHFSSITFCQPKEIMEIKT
mgnify:CR=1 FL=1